MKPRLGRYFFAAILLAAVAFLIWHFTRPQPVKVLVRKIDRGIIEETVVNTRAGTVKACRRAKIAPAIGGQIDKLLVQEGDSVKKDDLLLELWNHDLLAQVELAKSEARSARASAESSCLQADIAERQAKRFQELQKTSAVSEEQLDQTLTTAKSSRAACVAAQASAEVSQARVEVAGSQLERTRLTAPFNGIIAEINGEVGEYITPSPPGIPTLPAVDLVDSGCFYVTAPIDEVDAASIRTGMKAGITLDAFGDRVFPGRVRRIADYVLDREKQARTVDIEVTFADQNDLAYLLPGYSADAEVILQTRKNVVRVSSEAVIDGTKIYIFIPGKNILEERRIQTGLANWDYTEIISGAEAGELAVISVARKGVVDGAEAVLEEKNND